MKHKTTMISGSILLGGVLIFGLYGIGKSIASGYNQGSYAEYEHDDDDDYYGRQRLVQNKMYQEECGSCHMAYPAPLLPAQSWQNMMAELENHFGENAELDAQSRHEIEGYLVTVSNATRYKKMSRNMRDYAPQRITQLPYFIHEHDEIPSAFIQGNDKVKSLSQCNSCHKRAEQGDFDEDNVVIPGIGRWDD